MKDGIGMVLGRHFWWRGPEGWQREAFVPGDGATLAQRLAEWKAATGGGRVGLVFEPEGLAHQAVEMPRVGRSAFVTLDRIRRDFPVVASEVLGWGIERPAGTGTSFLSLLHFELTPLLVRLVDRPGLPVVRAAWPAFTVAAAAAGGPAEEGPRSVLFLLPDFVALAQWGGARRVFKAWTAPLSERDWKAVGIMLGEFAEPAGSRPDQASRRGPVSIVAHDGSAAGCPFWPGLQLSGRIERELTLDDLAQRARRLPTRHPANLAAAFPRPLALDRALAAATLVAAAVFALMILATLLDQRAARLRLPADQAQIEALERTLASLRRNETEFKALHAEVYEYGKLPPLDRADALRNLAAALPDAATLTRLKLGPEDAFQLSAAVTGPGFDAARFPELLAGAGLASLPSSGVNFDPARGTVEARGQLGGRP